MTTQAAAILSAERVCAQRPGEDGQPQEILHEVSFAVHPGEIVAVVGPSGCGKSTLLRLCNRLLETSSGGVLFAGDDIRNFDPPALRAQVVMVPQKPYLFPGTVRENIGFSGRLRRETPIDFKSESARELLEICQIDRAWLDRDGQRLSLGQQQRVCLARALAGPCKVLLLDEPTSALDRPTADALTRTFRTLADRKGLAVVLVTHDLRVAERAADRLLLLLDGEVHAHGPVAEVLASPDTGRVRNFLVPSTSGEGADE